MSIEKYLNKITQGDCYELIKKLPSNSVDCVYTDVPYLMPNQGGMGFMAERIDRMRNEELKDIKSGIDLDLLKEFVRVCKTLNIYIWCNKFLIKDIMKFFIEECECEKYEVMVWCKSNPIPMTNNVWLSDVEYCLWFGETATKLNDGYELKSKWHTSPINKADKYEYEHPTIKPLSLVKRHILHSTQPNDIVLDTFVGSGTTAIACKETGRQFIAFEIEPKWVQVAEDRLNGINAHGQISMFLK